MMGWTCSLDWGDKECIQNLSMEILRKIRRWDDYVRMELREMGHEDGR
jgi:hypothetical protein